MDGVDLHKNKLDTRRFKHDEVTFGVTYEVHQNWYKQCLKNILTLLCPF